MKRIALFVVPLIIVAVGVAYFIYNKPHKNIKSAEIEMTVTATQLLEEYENNEKQANAKYFDKVVAVEGVVKSKSKSEEGNVQIYLDTGNPMSSVACSMDYLSEQDGLEAVQKGDKVTIKGLCTGKLMDIVIDRAILVH